MKKKINWKIIGIVTFGISILFVIPGLDKLWASDAYRNSYVGGDAYNYIINASRATAYFVLALFFAVLSIGSGIFYILENKESLMEKNVAKKEVIVGEPSNTEDESEAWFCSKCNAKNNVENIFCNKCGEKKEE